MPIVDHDVMAIDWHDVPYITKHTSIKACRIAGFSSQLLFGVNSVVDAG